MDGSENQEVYIEKIPNYNMRLNDEEFNEEYPSSDGVESDDDDREDFVEN